jgi:hypothetical protein
MRGVAIAAAAAMLSCVAGCGDDTSPATEVSKAVDSVRSAAATGDAGKLCGELFTAALRKRVETVDKKPCEQPIRQRVVPALAGFTVNNVQLQDGDKRAVVDITDKNGDRDKLYMLDDGGAWKVDGILKPGSGTLKTPGG